ncbi:hypothetical protein VNI00_001183 [Paramarasmius palmivorus]|uniref:Uncharacterized protein n=1 Tax=Paramarasmius palmivorus TaxID=297713 RepID=A0AAW0EAK6_9AGAR
MTHGCGQMSDAFVYVLATRIETLNLSLRILDRIQHRRPPNHFRLHISSSETVRTELVLLPGGRMQTSFGLPIDIVRDDFFDYMTYLPDLQWLQLHQPLRRPVHASTQQSTFSVLQHRLRNFAGTRITVSLLLDGLSDILQIISRLPNCNDIRFVDWDLVEDRYQLPVMVALFQGLSSFNNRHTVRVLLPGEDYSHQLEEALQRLKHVLCMAT